MDKTNIYLHLYDYTTGDSVNLYLGINFGQPEDITCEGQLVLGTICLDQNPTYDFIDLKYNTMVLSLKRLRSASDKYRSSTKMEKDSSEKIIWKQQFLF